MRPLNPKSQAVTVTSSLTTLFIVNTSGMLDWIGIELLNTGTAATNDLQIQVSYFPGGNYYTLFTKTQFDAFIAGTAQPPANFFFSADTNPATIGATTGSSWLRFQMRGICDLRIQAKTAAGSAIITANYCGNIMRHP